MKKGCAIVSKSFLEDKKVIDFYLRSGHSLSDIFNKRQEKIIRLRFGLDGGKPLPLIAIGDQFQTTVQSIRGSLLRYFRQLKHPDVPLMRTLQNKKRYQDGKIIIDSFFKKGLSLSEILIQRHEKVIRLHFGLDSGKPMTIQSIANKFQLTKGEIRLIIFASLKKLKHPENYKGLSFKSKRYKERKKILDAYIKTGRPLSKVLNERQEKIVRLRFGLNSQKPMTLQAIANKFQMTKERIRQIVELSIKKLAL